MAETDDDSPDHLGQKGRSLNWDWGGEDPVEIVLVLFILVLFFMMPRPDCSVDINPGTAPPQPAVQQASD